MEPYPLVYDDIPANELLGGRDVRKSGMLRKKIGGRKLPLLQRKYNLRFVIIKKGWVYYYKDKSSKKPNNKFSLHGFSNRVFDAEEEQATMPFTFKIYSLTANAKTRYFACESRNNMDEWMESFRLEIEKYNSRDCSKMTRQFRSCPEQPRRDANSHLHNTSRPQSVNSLAAGSGGELPASQYFLSISDVTSSGIGSMASVEQRDDYYEPIEDLDDFEYENDDEFSADSQDSAYECENPEYNNNMDQNNRLNQGYPSRQPMVGHSDIFANVPRMQSSAFPSNESQGRVLNLINKFSDPGIPDSYIPGRPPSLPPAGHRGRPLSSVPLPRPVSSIPDSDRPLSYAPATNHLYPLLPKRPVSMAHPSTDNSQPPILLPRQKRTPSPLSRAAPALPNQSFEQGDQHVRQISYISNNSKHELPRSRFQSDPIPPTSSQADHHTQQRSEELGTPKNVHLLNNVTTPDTSLILQFSKAEREIVKYLGALIKFEYQARHEDLVLIDVHPGHTFNSLESNTKYYVMVYPMFENGKQGKAVKSEVVITGETPSCQSKSVRKHDCTLSNVELIEMHNLIRVNSEVGTLEFCNCRIGNDYCKPNQRNTAKCKILKLTISYTDYFKEFSQFFYFTFGQSEIKSLCLVYANLDDLDVESLHRFMRMNQIKGIENLDLSYNEKIGPEGFERIGNIISEQGIKKLKLIDCDLGETKLTKLLDGLKNYFNLRELDISCNDNLAERGFEVLGKLVASKKIAILKLSGCLLTENTIKLFYNKLEEEYAEKCSVKELDVSYNTQLSPVAWKILGLIIKKFGITTLNLAGCGICGEHLESLIKDTGNTEIYGMNLRDNAYPGNIVVEIADIIIKFKLHELDISDCMFSVSELKEFRNILKKTRLYKLHIGDQGRELSMEYIHEVCQLLQNVEKMLYLRFYKLDKSCRRLLKEQSDKLSIEIHLCDESQALEG